MPTKDLQTFIFIGRSGSGKGTQARLLEEYLKKTDPSREVLYIETGAEFREFIHGPTLTQKISKELYEAGELFPEFLTVYTWANLLIKKFSGKEHIIIDGTPRKYHEAGVLDSIFDFYGLKNKFIINIDISREESKKRLSARRRLDDNDEDIEKRLAWYETDVAPALKYYIDNPKYVFLKIDGERPVEEIHRDIVEKISK